MCVPYVCRHVLIYCHLKRKMSIKVSNICVWKKLFDVMHHTMYTVSSKYHTNPTSICKLKHVRLEQHCEGERERFSTSCNYCNTRSQCEVKGKVRFILSLPPLLLLQFMWQCNKVHMPTLVSNNISFLLPSALKIDIQYINLALHIKIKDTINNDDNWNRHWSRKKGKAREREKIPL